MLVQVLSCYNFFSTFLVSSPVPLLAKTFKYPLIPCTSTVFLSCTQQHLFLFPNVICFPTFSFNRLSCSLVPSFFVCPLICQKQKCFVSVEIQFVLKRKNTVSSISKTTFSWLQKELMRFACMLIFSSPLWPVRLEKHWDIQGQLLWGLIRELQIYVASSEKSQLSK